MSKDLQFVAIVDDIVVVDVSEVDGAVPRTIRVQVRTGARDAVRLQVNGYAVDAFTIASDTVILAVPGAFLDGVAVEDMSVLVFSGRWTGSEKVRLALGPTMNIRPVEGVQKLVQQVVKGILSNTGSNRFAPEEGGDLLRGLGRSLSPSSRAQIATIVAQAVSLTEVNMLSRQSGFQNLRLSEKLLRLTLQGLEFSEETMEVRARIRLYTMAGTISDIPLTL
jgi:hypothetical protein